jgi:rare lipoprotein A
MSGRTKSFLGLIALVLFLSGCISKRVPYPSCKINKKYSSRFQKGPQKQYSVYGKSYKPLRTAHGFVQEGVASWYGPKFHGRRTASGEIYNMYDLTAAHKILPMHTKVKVTNLENGRSLIVRINDRGPFVKNRIIDLSYAAAKKLGMVGPGTARVRIEALGSWSPDIPGIFYVQIGSFAVYENATALQRKMYQKGFVHTRVQKFEYHGQTFWRVQAGIFKSLAQAKSTRARLERKYPNAFIIAD